LGWEAREGENIHAQSQGKTAKTAVTKKRVLVTFAFGEVDFTGVIVEPPIRFFVHRGRLNVDAFDVEITEQMIGLGRCICGCTLSTGSVTMVLIYRVGHL
jgi:putative methionine-R-sulfoxide reductase with GAF domain